MPKNVKIQELAFVLASHLDAILRIKSERMKESRQFTTVMNTLVNR
ncbi:hypothetical protein ABGF49_03225 [Helcococcus ovis]|nr:hypothetical protein [Helcococcus ovis]